MNSATLEFFVKMRDMMSGGMAKMAQNAKTAFNTAQTAAQGLYQKNDKLGQSYDALSKKARQFEDTIKKSTSLSQIRAAQKELTLLQAQMRQNPAFATAGGGGTGKVGVLGGALGMAGRFVAPLAIAGALGGMAMSGIKANMAYGATSKSFEVLTESRTKGNDLASSLNRLQQNTILGPEVFQEAKTMMSFGVAADKVLPTLKMLGDISMGDADKLNRLTLAFSQTASAGRLMGQDLLQYINAGFNPLQEISKKTGKSMAQLRKDMEDGAISFKMVEDAFKSATGEGGRFNDMMGQIADTSFGKAQILAGQWENFKIQLGGALMPLAEGMINLGSSTLRMLNISQTAPQVLMGERAEVNGLFQSITTLNEGNELRTTLLDTLVKKYPDLMAGIDKEKVSNEQLITKLTDVNRLYQDRIDLATAAYNADKFGGKADKAYAEYVRLSSIAIAKREGNEAGAKGLMTLPERLNNLYSRLPADWFQSKAETKLFISKRNRGFADAALAAQTQAENESLVTQVRAMTKNKEAMAEIARYDGAPNLYDYSRLKKFVTPADIKTGEETTVNAAGKSNTSGGSIGRGITGGGPRQVTVNIQKLVERLEYHNHTGGMAMDDVQRQFEELFLRILNSGARVQS